jgi:hypothetical protein
LAFLGQALARSRTSPARASSGTRPAVFSLFFFFFGGTMMYSDGADVIIFHFFFLGIDVPQKLKKYKACCLPTDIAELRYLLLYLLLY